MNKSNWIRDARKNQGLKGFQLAERMQVSAARVSVLEKDEARGAVTLKLMAKAAKAMGCRFEYRIVPDMDLLEERKSNLSAASGKPRYRVTAK